MRAVLQRASRASVVVDGAEVASFDRQGIVALVGVTHEDGPEQVETIARKIADLRLLDDERSVADEDAPSLSSASSRCTRTPARAAVPRGTTLRRERWPS